MCHAYHCIYCILCSDSEHVVSVSARQLRSAVHQSCCELLSCLSWWSEWLRGCVGGHHFVPRGRRTSKFDSWTILVDKIKSLVWLSDHDLSFSNSLCIPAARWQRRGEESIKALSCNRVIFWFLECKLNSPILCYHSHLSCLFVCLSISSARRVWCGKGNTPWSRCCSLCTNKARRARRDVPAEGG